MGQLEEGFSGAEEVAEKFNMEGKGHASAAKAAMKAGDLTDGLKAVPFKNPSFSAACKARNVAAVFGMAEQLAEKRLIWSMSITQGLKPEFILKSLRDG